MDIIISRVYAAIKMIRTWQQSVFVDHVCCNTDGCFTKLEPRINVGVELYCPKCNFATHQIPHQMIDGTLDEIITDHKMSDYYDVIATELASKPETLVIMDAFYESFAPKSVILDESRMARLKQLPQSKKLLKAGTEVS